MAGGVIGWIYDRAWAIVPESLHVIIEAAERWNGGAVDTKPHLERGGISTDSAIQRKGMEPMPGASRVFLRESTAVIPVIGPIFPRANLLTQVSGATSAETLAADFSRALNNEAVERIVFDIDSPGGQVTQVSELSQLIYDSRGVKPVIAYASGTMASAAYWIGSAADEVIVSDTSMVGSIGVIAALRDDSEREARDGIRRHTFVSSVSPNKLDRMSSDEGRARIQALVDSQGRVFLDAVARNRETDAETVMNDYGKGGVFVGADAVAAGLADVVGTFEGLFALRGGSGKSKTKKTKQGREYMAGKNQDGEFTISIEGVKESSPETYEAIFERGVSAGIERGQELERNRLQAIDALKAPGFEDVVAEHKYNAEMTAEKIAKIVLDAQAERQANAAAANRQDAEKLGETASKLDQGGHDDAEAQQAERDAVIKAMADGAAGYRPGSGQGGQVSVNVPDGARG